MEPREEQAVKSFEASLAALDLLAFVPPPKSPPRPFCLEDLDRYVFVEGQSAGASPPPTWPVAPARKGKRSSAPPEQDLYVMTSSAFPGLVKVGRSNRPERRRLDLSRGQPVHYTLDVVFHGAGEHEPAVHRQLAAMRHREGHSREWFSCTPDDVVEAFRTVAPSKVEQIERKTVEISFLEECLSP
jgi:hypothetical protein